MFLKKNLVVCSSEQLGLDFLQTHQLFELVTMPAISKRSRAQQQNRHERLESPTLQNDPLFHPDESSEDSDAALSEHIAHDAHMVSDDEEGSFYGSDEEVLREALQNPSEADAAYLLGGLQFGGVRVMEITRPRPGMLTRL